MSQLSFDNLTIVGAVAFVIPFLIGLMPAIRLPAIALEILAGFAVGPHGFGWASIDAPVQVFAAVGLSTLLFLAGFEFDVRSLQGPRLKSIMSSFVASLGLALILAFILNEFRLETTTILLTTIFASTSLGLIVPLLKDAHEESSAFGQLVIAAASLGEIGPLVLLSLMFSASAEKVSVQLVLLIGLVLAIGLIGLAVTRAQRVAWLSEPVLRLADTSAQLRIRAVVLLLGTIAVFAYHLGFEAILGAFLAGALLAQLSGSPRQENLLFRQKLDAIGFGVFIPVFFIASGMRLDLPGLIDDHSALAKVPLYLAALLIARGIPTLFFREQIGMRRSIAGGFLEATSLSFVVAASGIGLTTGLLDENTAAALVGAGLLSALLFPLIGMAIAGRSVPEPEFRTDEFLAEA